MNDNDVTFYYERQTSDGYWPRELSALPRPRLPRNTARPSRSRPQGHGRNRYRLDREVSEVNMQRLSRDRNRKNKATTERANKETDQ